MISIVIQDFTVRYSDKIIFDHTSFSAECGTVTVICGESGTGKTTLLDALLFRHSCHYEYQGKDLSEWTEEKKQQFIADKIGVVYQMPSFIDKLTIKEHIAFVMDLYQLTMEEKSLKEALGIDQMLEKYPGQLSGGEKTRAALYLALLKKPEILLLDEPTASLDKDHKECVIQILQAYAQEEGNCVIVATHDALMMEEADVTYHIKDHQLVCCKRTKVQEHAHKKERHKIHTACFSRYVSKIRRNDELYYKILMLLLSCTIGFLVLSSSLNNASISQMKGIINDAGSKEFIVFKPIFEQNEYSFESSEYPMEEEEVEAIRGIQGVERVEWRFDTSIQNAATWFSTKENDAEQANDFAAYRDEMQVVTSYDENQKLTSETADSLMQHTYMDDYDYSSRIQKDYSSEGVYVSRELFLQLFPENVSSPWIEFHLMVPLYDATGVSQVPNEMDEESFLPANHTACEYIKVKVPVKGVLKDNTLTHELYYANQIYLSQNDLMNYVQQQNIEESSVYCTEQNECFYGTKPKEEVIQTVHRTKWKPNAYSVVVDDLKNLNQVVMEIKEKGFQVSSHYFDAKTILSVKESVKHTMMMASGILTALVVLLYFFIAFINRKQQIENDRFLWMHGLSEKQCSQFHYKEWFYNWRKQVLTGCLWYLILRYIFMYLKIAFMQIDPMAFVKVAVLALLLEFVFPMVIRKVQKK